MGKQRHGRKYFSNGTRNCTGGTAGRAVLAAGPGSEEAAATEGHAMFNGAHVLIYSTDPEADRAFFRDVLEFPHVDIGGGWMIFGLPRSEVGVHPSDENNVHALSLMTDDVAATVAALATKGQTCPPVEDHGYGLVTFVGLPGGGRIQIYQPRHATPPSP
jgi:hypothetical protein